MTRSDPPRRLPVWPYFFLSGLAAILGGIFVIFWGPSGYPDKVELTKLSGDIRTVVVKNEISKTTAGSILPALTSVYFTLQNVDGAFRYPSTHPKFPRVRDETAVAVDIWVRKAEIGKNAPATIWQLHERNPRDSALELTHVSYDEVVDRLVGADRSVANLGFWLLVASVGLLSLGLVVRRWNRARAEQELKT
ncbi:MAG: hypothetical protein ACR2O4_01120 [Hyphomicrobiaceae bacterium]